ncbi:undecaprenyl-diphosphate phosphatase [Cohnella lubricantis]|uniref:Undecaprenyl-diphosphatase n=1 Tax=Cohnella lubricantis TaxID=2163172 RepID=A0A841TDZ0_9BACL|nr:undecaprenyl-diphosphate phosphatase [Cohnella lubricantis]MBB6677548.1 undecaprenyl-diphosphate phosphatase [Cohnella lubricantis]MBP2116566.1 undecaprenyl-diphosphatase [Cohnella lubricantis]
MLHWLDSVILGIVEGLTEFLPVSSSGHMILTNKLLGYGEAPDILKTFEVIIQFAAILAIALVYRQKILQVFGIGHMESVKGLSVDKLSARPRLNLLHVAIAIVPALGLAFILRHPIKELGFSQYPVLLSLIVGGIYMWVSEALYDKGQIKRTAETMDDISYKQALVIGLLQCLSLWPGFSRSGSTIAAGMLSGLSYRAAADFSFFIAIPVMTVATGYELLDNLGNFRSEDIGFFVTGFLVSFAVAWIVIVGFLRVMQKVKLKYFAWYRFALAILFYLFIMR